MTISDATRQLVRKRADYLCEYCHSSEEASAAQFAIDHIQPRSLNGSDDLENLALACQRCNGYRYNFTSGVDPVTQKTVPLFNPRIQQWSEHFSWTEDGLRIVGLTSVGRATCDRLDLNDDQHNDGSIIKARRLWIKGGWHPPASDRPSYNCSFNLWIRRNCVLQFFSLIESLCSPKPSSLIPLLGRPS